jgi:Flp pilus assembly pilin Flp
MGSRLRPALESSLRRREDGVTTTEYAIVLVLVAVGAVTAYAGFGGHLGDYWDALVSAI